jgi:membrane associated rhomboid family serine protease
VKAALRIDGMAWALLTGLLCVGAIVVTAICAEGGRAPAAAPLASLLDWQAALGLREPWRLWTCAWVHWNAAHLGVNLAGGAVVAFVGWRARLPRDAALAWLLAWPLTQLAMATLGADRLGAAMPHYGGLSGVLHAGVVVLGLTLAWPLARLPAPRSRPDTGFVATRASAIEPTRITEGPWAMTEMGVHTAAAPLDTPASVPVEPAERPLRERWIGVAIVAGTLAKVLLEAPWQLAPVPDAALGIAVAPLAHACGLVAGLLAWGVVRTLGRGAR